MLCLRAWQGKDSLPARSLEGKDALIFFSPFDHSRHFEYKVVFFTNALLSRFCIKKSRHRERAGISDDVKTLTSYRCCLPPIPRPGLVLTLRVSSGFYIYGLPPSIKEQLSPLISIYKQPAYQQEIPNRSARVEFVSSLITHSHHHFLVHPHWQEFFLFFETHIRSTCYCQKEIKDGRWQNQKASEISWLYWHLGRSWTEMEVSRPSVKSSSEI